MKRILTIPSHFYFFVLVGIFMTMAASLGIVSAEDKKCYGQYGQQIDCPIQNKAFTVEKFVKVNDTWQNNRSGIEPGNNVQYLIHVKNTGEVVTKLLVKDILPQNVTFVKVETKDGQAVTSTKIDSTITWETVVLSNGQSAEYIITGTVNGTGVAESTEKCGIENVAEIYFDNKLEGKDSAFICVKKGAVLAQLPETGAIDWATSWVSLAVVLQLAGLLILNLMKFSKVR